MNSETGMDEAHSLTKEKVSWETLRTSFFILMNIIKDKTGVLSVCERQVFRLPEKARRQLQMPWGEGYRWL